jgi:hypothetical protein
MKYVLYKYYKVLKKTELHILSAFHSAICDSTSKYFKVNVQLPLCLGTTLWIYTRDVQVKPMHSRPWQMIGWWSWSHSGHSPRTAPYRCSLFSRTKLFIYKYWQKMNGISKYVLACPFQPITNKNNLDVLWQNNWKPPIYHQTPQDNMQWQRNSQQQLKN